MKLLRGKIHYLIEALTSPDENGQRTYRYTAWNGVHRIDSGMVRADSYEHAADLAAKKGGGKK